jgi:L-arabinose isomerase
MKATIMIDLKEFEVWFVTGSQHLYGAEVLKQVADHSRQIADYLGDGGRLPCRIRFKPVLTTPEEIAGLCQEANSSEKCVGLITWMHTFSPARMWIAGLNLLRKPFVHLHTQFNRDIPWDSIDMDFMNLNQSAHGDREFGHICSRMRQQRKVIVGHWQDEEVVDSLNIWIRAACAWRDWQGMKVARFGDNMREVAVTEGDKVAAQIKFGYAVNGYGVGDLVACIAEVKEKQIDALVKEYNDSYRLNLSEGQMQSVREAAQIESGLRAFLERGGFKAFTNTFENLHGFTQLPGLPVQRLMAEGYGFGAEGDWKTAALVRAMKVMAAGLTGGTSFMEDYTYHFEPGRMLVLGAHMLEVCPTIAGGEVSLQVHPLGIGGKNDPARLVFNAATGDGINASLVDLGNRFRLLVNPCRVVAPEEMPRLPVARALWEPKPNLKVAAAAWILGGGAHHSGFSLAVTVEHLRNFAEIAGIECLVIDAKTTIEDFKQDLRVNEVYYMLEKGFA